VAAVHAGRTADVSLGGSRLAVRAEITRDRMDEIMTQAGIENFRCHDRRYAWASWHVQHSTNLQELMELGWWKLYRMVLLMPILAETT